MATKSKSAKAAPKAAKVTIRTAKSLDEMLLAIRGKTVYSIAESAQKGGLSAESYRLLFAAIVGRKVNTAARAAEARAAA